MLGKVRCHSQSRHSSTCRGRGKELGRVKWALQLCLFYFLKRWQNGNNMTKWYNNMHELWVWVCELLSRCFLICYSILRREGYRRKERADEMHLQELGKWYYIEVTKPGARAPTHLFQEQAAEHLVSAQMCSKVPLISSSMHWPVMNEISYNLNFSILAQNLLVITEEVFFFFFFNTLVQILQQKGGSLFCRSRGYTDQE